MRSYEQSRPKTLPLCLAGHGLTPRKYASGEIDRNGAISKSGDRLAREALFVAAHSLLTRVTRWSTLKAWGTAIAKRRGLRRALGFFILKNLRQV